MSEPNGIRATIDAFRELTFSATVTSEAMKRLLNVVAPKYIRTELKFPRKKKRGTMRKVNKKNGEVISREDALNFRVSRGLQEDGIVYVPMKEVKDYLRGLPSAQPEQAECIQDTKAVPDDRDMVCLSERVTATYYDDEHEEWSQKTVAIADVLDSVCDDYTVLPSAQPEPKKGKWIKKGGKHICPNCGSGYGNAQLPHSFNYCPNCGCKTEA